MIRRIKVEMIVHVDDKRGIDLRDQSNWCLVLLDTKTGELIFDTELDRQGERSFRPTITIG